MDKPSSKHNRKARHYRKSQDTLRECSTLSVNLQGSSTYDVRTKGPQQKTSSSSFSHESVLLHREQACSSEMENQRCTPKVYESKSYQLSAESGSYSCEVERLLQANRVVSLEKPSTIFPKARWFCRLCHQHFNQIGSARNHCSSSAHVKKKAILDLRKIILALPQKLEAKHQEALDAELHRVYVTNYMNDENISMRHQIIREMESYLLSKFNFKEFSDLPQYIVMPKLQLYGSSFYGMGLTTSNINVDLQFPKSIPMSNQAKIFLRIFQLLQQWPEVQSVQAQLNQRVPKLSILHRSSRLSIDISIGSNAALKTSRLLADYASLDRRVRPLTVCFRYWASRCQLDNPQVGSLPAHVFPILTIYFLQQHCFPAVLPCIHDMILPNPAVRISSNTLKTGNTDRSPNVNDGNAMENDNEGDEYQSPSALSSWKSSNVVCLAELWVTMLRFYAAEFKMRKWCVSIRSYKRVSLSSRRWSPRFLGIEDPFCRKKSLGRSIVSDQMMTYLVQCIRSSSIYFGVPRESGVTAIYDPAVTLDLDIVEDPDGDDIEDGLAADEDPEDDDDDQEVETVHDDFQEENSVLEEACCAGQREAPVQLRGWNQTLPDSVVFAISQCKQLNFSMENVLLLTGNMFPPKVCIVCRQIGHWAFACSALQLPEATVVHSDAFKDPRGIITQLCEYINITFRPSFSDRELNMRVDIVKELERFIQSSMPDIFLTLFGSSRNGFSLHKADLDICLKYRDREVLDEETNVRDVVTHVATILSKHPLISAVQPIPSAKVPIVKFHHDSFDVDGDISLYNVLAEQNTAMLRAYSEIDERVVPLGATLKQLVRLCDMGDASRGSLSSYAYVIMLIHYLQQEGVLPVLQCLPPVTLLNQKSSSLPVRMVDGWNAYFFDDIGQLDKVWPYRGRNKKTIGQLWLGLLDYYSTRFCFELNVICIRQLEPLTRLEKMWTLKGINIEDPFDLDHNLGTGVSAKST